MPEILQSGTGFAVLVKCPDGRQFLAHGKGRLPFCEFKRKDANAYARELRPHLNHKQKGRKTTCKVVKIRFELTVEP